MAIFAAMRLAFSKWHGTGNDFILLDDRVKAFPDADMALVRRLCHRHFGIGSDGLILLRTPDAAGADFHMEFFNPDGSKSFCGNGSRCAFAAWSALNGNARVARFSAIDGIHEGEWADDEVAISLPPPRVLERGIDGPDADFIDTGSPHLLLWRDAVEAVDILTDAPPRRNAPRFAPGGTNVNYVQRDEAGIVMRTFERGVEAETLSCGSGVVAAALSAALRGAAHSPVPVRTRGGALRVEASLGPDGAVSGIRLIGPVRHVFDGNLDV